MISPITDITLENSLTMSDSDVGDPRHQLENSNRPLTTNSDD